MPDENLVKTVIENLEGWVEKKKILVILAHPDDPEFFCGGMIARWCLLGHTVDYCLITKGQRGFMGNPMDPEEVAKTRMEEQRKAASVLGVQEVYYLDYQDGSLVPEIGLREDIVGVIRKLKPQIVVTSDPQNLFPAVNRINHPDHRAAGQAVVDAVFPAAGNPQYSIVSESGEQFEPHQIEELWITLTNQPEFSLDLTEFFEQRVGAILCHQSQIAIPREQFVQHLKSRMKPDPSSGQMKYSEYFRRVRFLIN